MVDTIQTQYGQALNLTFTFWQDADKTTPVDLTGATLTIREASRQAFYDATVVLSDAIGGAVVVNVPEIVAQQLPTGVTSWFKVEAQWPGENIVTPAIKVHVNA